MANDTNTTNQVDTGVESTTVDKKTKNGYKGKNTGMNVSAMMSGIGKGYSIDGSISVPSQSNQVIARSYKKTDHLIGAIPSNPGFGRISYLPIFGSDKRQESWAALTKQGSNLWRTIRSATPHAERYQAGDVMANLVITGGLRYGLAECKRKIQSLTWAAENNQFIQNGIWRALTNYPDSTSLTTLQGKLVGWKNRYNGIVNTLAAVEFPDIFPIFKRWEYMSSVIFRDAMDETQAQFYAFTATHIYDWQIREDPDDPGMDLIPIHLPDDIDELLNELDRIAVKVTSDSDMSDMFADIVLAFPAAQCMKWQLMTDADIAVGTKMRSVHDMDVKWALHNAQVANCNAPTWHVTPAEGSIHGQIVLPTGKRALGFAPPVMATNNDKMDMTRFMNMTQWVLYDADMEYDVNSQGIELLNTPTEILTGIRIFYFKWNYTTGERTVGQAYFEKNTYLGYSTNEWANVNPTLSYLEWANYCAYLTFAYFPLFRVMHVQRPADITQDQCTPDNITEEAYIGSMMEIERPFIANEHQIVQRHNAARVGLWNIPVQLINGKRNGNK